MDSIAQLALISKAKKVFANEGTFLSFPVTPLAYKKEDFEFFSQETAEDLIQSKENLHAFSTLVNLIPSDEAWLPTETRFLWDEYENILDQGICATSTRTPAEEKAFQEAKAYLKVPGEGGIMQDSPQVQVYKQYKDAYIITEQEFMEARSTGEAANDVAEKKKWREIDEPAFRARLQELENQWVLEGNKNEVEIAQSKLVLLGAKSPILTWAEWQAQFNPDLNSETGISDLSRVFPTSIAPSNALEEGAWKSFSLSEAEVNLLVNEAPEELRRRFSASGKASSIKSMALEFSSAAINRSWFDSELFRSRFWKLSDTAKVISDGGRPPSGQCPSYVTAIVFARKVVVEQKQATPTKPKQTVPTDLRFNYVVKNQKMIRRINPAILKAVQPQMIKKQSIKPQVKIRKPLPAQTIKMKNQNLVASKSATIRMAAQPTTGRVMMKPGTAARPIDHRLVMNPKVPTFIRLPTKPVKKPVPPPPRPQSVLDKNIYILAFICKPLPKCPDPDPTLQW